jgi:hypothetical protein
LTRRLEDRESSSLIEQDRLVALVIQAHLSIRGNARLNAAAFQVHCLKTPNINGVRLQV